MSPTPTPPDARLRVVHETRHRYTAEVASSRQLLHLVPRQFTHQKLLDHRLAIEPTASEMIAATDYFGNSINRAVISVPHMELRVRAESVVILHARDVAAADTCIDPWEQCRDELAAARTAADRGAAEFLFDSPHVPASAALSAFATRIFQPRRPLVEAVRELSSAIHRDFEFDPSATSISTPIDEVLQIRRGVCQDFAHLMIGCLRSAGLAARYVSGYILTNPPPGQPRLIGADGSHAWVSVHMPRLGWTDFDPTNDCQVDREHVTLAWGRDFSDVTPARGVILGGGEQKLATQVTVSPEA